MGWWAAGAEGFQHFTQGNTRGRQSRACGTFVGRGTILGRAGTKPLYFVRTQSPLRVTPVVFHSESAWQSAGESVNFYWKISPLLLSRLHHLMFSLYHNCTVLHCGFYLFIFSIDCILFGSIRVTILRTSNSFSHQLEPSFSASCNPLCSPFVTIGHI